MTPALDLLKKVRAEHRVHSYEHDPKAASYGLEAAEKLGLEPAQVFKTLLASSEKGELLVAVVPVVGFFKQKTAYEMVSCDWSSDVCSSDLFRAAAQRLAREWLRLRLRVGGADINSRKTLGTFINKSAQTLLLP